MSEEESETDNLSQAEEVDNQLNQTYSDLLDVNQEILQSSREKAQRIQELRELYLDQAARCEEIARLHILGAQIVGSTFGDILANEWGVSSEEVDDDGEEEENH